MTTNNSITINPEKTEWTVVQTKKKKKTTTGTRMMIGMSNSPNDQKKKRKGLKGQQLQNKESKKTKKVSTEFPSGDSPSASTTIVEQLKLMSFKNHQEKEKHCPSKPSFIKLATATSKSSHQNNFAGNHIPVRKNTFGTSLVTMKAVEESATLGWTLARKNDRRNRIAQTQEQGLMGIPTDLLCRIVFPFLDASDLCSFASTCRSGQSMTQSGHLWKPLVKANFLTLSSSVVPLNNSEWKTAYKLASLGIVEKNRCFKTHKTFIECILGVGIDYTVNPKTRRVDYIGVSQDLMSWEDAYKKQGIRTDSFGQQIKLFLPLYFSKEHFGRSLGQIKVMSKLCGGKPFHPNMVLDVFPKIVNQFVVMLSDEGIAASEKSFQSFVRIHRLFLALAEKFPSIKRVAVTRLRDFIRDESKRLKRNCPSLGSVLPLLMIVDQNEMDWNTIQRSYLTEQFDRCALWICKSHPHFEVTTGIGAPESQERSHERVELSFQSMMVSLRHSMFHSFFLRMSCQGSSEERAIAYDRLFFQRLAKDEWPSLMSTTGNDGEIGMDVDTPSTSKMNEISFQRFRHGVNEIMIVDSWRKFFASIGAKGCANRDEMGTLLRTHMNNSRKKRYHSPGMDFSRIQASGTSRLLSKGQTYSAGQNLKRVTFIDHWEFTGGTKYLDATCIIYAGKERLATVDYTETNYNRGTVRHSGDVMRTNGGSHTINLDLSRLPSNVTALFFVLSSWDDAKLRDIKFPRVEFLDSDAPEGTDPLCKYDLNAQDKVDHLTSVIMCKLYRNRSGEGFHVLAIGDNDRGCADNYGPIYDCIEKKFL